MEKLHSKTIETYKKLREFLELNNVSIFYMFRSKVSKFLEKIPN